MDCPSRTRRRDPGQSRVTPREILGLEFTSRAQPITTQHYQRLLGVHPRIARGSLQKLRNMGLVKVHLLALHEPNRITLTKKARGVLARALGRDPGEFRVMNGIGKVRLDHHERTVDLFVALTVACARTRSYRLVDFLLERDIRARIGNPHKSLVPDAIAVVEGPGGERRSVALEVDLGTENVNYVLRSKMEPYASLWQARHPLLGCDQWAVCCSVPKARRRNRLVKAAYEAEIPEGVWYFATTDSITERNILRDVWMTLRVQDDRARLVPESPFSIPPTNPSDCRRGQNHVTHRNQASLPLATEGVSREEMTDAPV